MKNQIAAELNRVLSELQKSGVLQNMPHSIALQKPPSHLDADYTTNIALRSAATAGLSSLEVAEKIVAHWGMQAVRAEVAAPGFINFYAEEGFLDDTQILKEVLYLEDKYGAGASKGKEDRILVEYVSANPTGPLHIGHARMAALGSSLVNVMNFAGYATESEYYVNDSGRQMRVLATSFCLRVAATQLGKEISIPAGFYQGDYLNDLAREWLKQEELPAATLDHIEAAAILRARPQKTSLTKMNMEAEIDALCILIEESLGKHLNEIKNFLLQRMTHMIKQDLEGFGCRIKSWQRESEVVSSEVAAKTLKKLRQSEFVYEKDKALWFAGTRWGDDKDRVLNRSNGEPTYFANDIIYHLDKYQRNYNRIINIWGADHHGYIARILAALKALGNDERKLEILLVQMVFLMNEGTQLSMSTRAGQFVSLKDFIQAVGKDAGRFMILMQKADRTLNFDVTLALSHSKDNPVYYVQYAYARLANILVELKRRNLDVNKEKEKGLASLNLLTDKREQRLIALLKEFPELIQKIAKSCDVSKLTLYLLRLAGDFHSYYNAVRVLGEAEQTPPRLCLCLAIKQVLMNGLHLLEVDAPERM